MSFFGARVISLIKRNSLTRAVLPCIKVSFNSRAVETTVSALILNRDDTWSVHLPTARAGGHVPPFARSSFLTSAPVREFPTRASPVAQVWLDRARVSHGRGPSDPVVGWCSDVTVWIRCESRAFRSADSRTRGFSMDAPVTLRMTAVRTEPPGWVFPRPRISSGGDRAEPAAADPTAAGPVGAVLDAPSGPGVCRRGGRSATRVRDEAAPGGSGAACCARRLQPAPPRPARCLPLQPGGRGRLDSPPPGAQLRPTTRPGEAIPDRPAPERPGPDADTLARLEAALGAWPSYRGLIRQLFWDGRREDDLARNGASAARPSASVSKRFCSSCGGRWGCREESTGRISTIFDARRLRIRSSLHFLW